MTRFTTKTVRAHGFRATFFLSTTMLVQPVFAEDTRIVDPVIVEGQSIPAITEIDTRRQDLPPSADIGELLKREPGIDAVRRSGHGLDPVIRGQQQGQLNIIGDGAFMFGGCPSRMDPPASLTSLDSYDSITVEKGFQSVLHGPGGSGGTVIMDRHAPDFEEDRTITLRFSAGGESNGSAYNTGVEAAHEIDGGYIRANGSKSRSGNYEDGSGTEIRSGYRQWGMGMDLAWSPDDLGEVTFSAERDRIDDALFAGLGMDSIYGVTDVFRLGYERDLESGAVSAVRTNAYMSHIDHLMDNFSLRTSAGFAQVPSTSDTLGVKMEGDVQVADIPFTIGFDYRNIDRTAIRFRGGNANAVNITQSLIWPGINSDEYGLFGEGVIGLDKGRSVKVGLRYDHVRVDAHRANETASVNGAINRTPNQLYALYFGKGFDDVTEHNVSGLVRVEQKLDEQSTAYLTIGRSVRTADATERGIAADNATATSRVVGNPDIDPEQHHQIDLGVSSNLAGYAVNASIYYDHVTDYIFRDRARGQTDVLLNDGAVVYRNIDASLAGFEIGFSRVFDNKVSMEGGLTYSYGENHDIDGALAQISPLKMSLDMSYPVKGWLLGLRTHAAMKQTRVDDDVATGSGRDVGETDGYVTADIYATGSLIDGIDMGVGITNILDKEYANHLNTSNAFDATETQVNEPGRSVYVNLTARF